jgi:hypothetical protein
MSPTLLRRRMFRRTRAAANVVCTAPASGLSFVVTASPPTSNCPALPVRRPPAMTGTDCPLLRPILLLKNMIGTVAVRAPKPACPPKSKIPWPSRKKSRFSG